MAFAAVLLWTGCDSGAPTEPEKESDRYEVTFAALPGTGGSVSPQSGMFEGGATVSLVATPATGWTFVRWEGDVAGTNPTTTLTVNTDKNVQAVFKKKTYYPLTVEAEGEGTVREEQLDAPKDGSYPQRASVRLIADPAEGWQFVRWEGDLAGSTNPQTIVMDEAKTVRAVFMPAAYALDVNVRGGGTVRTERTDDSKTSTYPHEAVVRLTAQPDPGWVFDHWEGDLSGTMNPQSITIDNAKYVVAVFERKQYALSTGTTGEGQITLELVSGDGTSDSGTSGDGNGGTYAYESEVKVTAEAAAGWRFVRWEGDLTGQANPSTITMDGAKDVQAVFTNAFVLDVTTTGQGRVNVEPDQAFYLENTEVTLTAQPDPGWLFVGWGGSVSGKKNPKTLTMTQDVAATATFKSFDAVAATDFYVLERDADTGQILRAKATIENRLADNITLSRVIIRNEEGTLVIDNRGDYILGPSESKADRSTASSEPSAEGSSISYFVVFFHRAPTLDYFIQFDVPISESTFESYTIEWYLEYGDSSVMKVTPSRL